MRADNNMTNSGSKKSLRRTLTLSLLGLALLPLAIVLAALFLVVRIDPADFQGIQLPVQLYEHINSIITQFAFLIVTCGVLATALAWRIASQFLQPVLEIRRGAEIISRINSNHRIELDSDDELEELAEEFNLMGEKLGKAYSELGERIQEATITVQEERNRLSTVLRTMADGVIVANETGEIILMNPRARIILNPGYSSGIGGALSQFFPRDRLDFYLKKVRLNWGEGLERPVEALFPLKCGKLLKGSISAVPGHGVERAGFLLMFRDMSLPGEAESLLDKTLQEMPLLLRGPLAASLALVDTLQRHQEMPADKQQTFLAAVSQEMIRLSDRVTILEEAGLSTRTSRWPAIPSNPLELLKEAAAFVPDVPVLIETDGNQIPVILVEPFSWMISLKSVLEWMGEKRAGKMPVGAHIGLEDGAVVTTFLVEEPFNGNLSELEFLEVSPSDEEKLLLGEAVRRNRGEFWTRSADGLLGIKLALLHSESDNIGESADPLTRVEPDFYDFDLFLPKPVVEKEEQLHASLADLEYVVFDTETTGMRLSQGDKVVSISGIRIRRGRILGADTFHTLVNPGRPIPPESAQFHKIEDHMVADAPSMNEVYPKFMEFVGDSILVAHNAAFDKKCIDMAAEDAKLPRIENPVLDTLFLSYALHNETEGHTLDAIAGRLGITIESRHTSMGDAQATARIFLALQSLLAGRGVKTLADAKAFCDRHLLLRWQSSRF